MGKYTLYLTKNKGFTLIETLVYLALLGLLFAGLLTAAFAVIEGLDMLKVCGAIQEEGNFILAKISRAIISAETATGKTNGIVLTNPDHIIEIDPSNENIKIDGDILNASTVKVKDLNFHIDGKEIGATLILRGKTSFGKNCERRFAITVYSRKQ